MRNKFHAVDESQTAGIVTETEAAEVADNPLKAARQKEIDAKNVQRSGKGLRLKVGATRGKGSQVIDYEIFDESKPDTMPGSVEEFLNILAKAQDGKAVSETEMLSYLVDGFNAQSYTNASDPIAEHIDASWPEGIQKAFRANIRSYMQMVPGLSVEDVVALVKPAIQKSLGK